MATRVVIITEQYDRRAMAAIASVFNIQQTREMILSYLSPPDFCSLASALSSAAIPKGPRPSIDRYIMHQGLMRLERSSSDLRSASIETVADIIRKFKKHIAITYSANNSLEPVIENRRRVVDLHITEVLVSDYGIFGTSRERSLARTNLFSFELGTVGEGLVAVGAAGDKVFLINSQWGLGRGKDDYMLIVYAPSYEKLLDYMIRHFCFSREIITPVVHRMWKNRDEHKEPDFETSGGWLHTG
ncbi:hypothetical protein [Endozoicomonas euniceicola]|uniref:Uncharacterized protein n=1 Tax=Endozoicomonas euniceicola TaxID=1234143 RepID=A0ABY6GNC0_9GAMM|nr:hypothetical protein [Endozoicomonas euniceicola]UYM14227.1 hypothetical protein NX720_15105 [Endozoicomonas euniceicola]